MSSTLPRARWPHWYIRTGLAKLLAATGVLIAISINAWGGGVLINDWTSQPADVALLPGSTGYWNAASYGQNPSEPTNLLVTSNVVGPNNESPLGWLNTYYLSDLDSGAVIQAFHQQIQIEMYNSGWRADGGSFYFGPTPTSQLAENPSSANGLVARLMTYPGNLQNGVSLGSNGVDSYNIGGNGYNDIPNHWTTWNIDWSGSTLHVTNTDGFNQAISTSNFTPQSSYVFSWGGRTGGVDESFKIASLNVVTATNSLQWTGAANGNWSLNSGDANWGAGNAYVDGLIVQFPDGASNANIAIQSGGVQPFAIDFTNSVTSYSFSGGPIQGAASVTLNGSGIVTFINSNAYTGSTSINGGTLEVGNGGSGASIGTTSGVTLANNATLAFNHSDAVTFSPSINGTGRLYKTGGGTLTLTGKNGYNGGTTVNVGVLSAQNAVQIPAGTITVIAGGTISFTPVDESSRTLAGRDFTIAGPGSAGQGAISVTVPAGSAVYSDVQIGNVTLANDATIGTFNAPPENGPISGIHFGEVGGALNLNNHTLTIVGDATTSSSLWGDWITGTGNIILGSGNLAVLSPQSWTTGTLTINSGAAFDNFTTFNFAVPITVNGGTINSIGNSLTLPGNISGIGNLAIGNSFNGSIANGVVTLTGSNGGLTGGITLIGGMLVLGGGEANAAGTGDLTIRPSGGWTTDGVELASNQSLAVVHFLGSDWSGLRPKGYTATVAGLDSPAGKGVIENYGQNESSGGAGGDGTIDVVATAGTNYFYSGYIRDIDNGGISSKINIVKDGPGMQTITGNVSYSGSTIVNAGVLKLQDCGASSTSLSVASGGTLMVYNSSNQAQDFGVGHVLSGDGTVIIDGAGTGDDYTTRTLFRSAKNNLTGVVNITPTGKLWIDNNGGEAGATIGTATVIVNGLLGLYSNGHTFSATIGGLNGNGRVVNENGNNAFTIGAGDGDGDFSGTISQGNNLLTLVKTGSGTQILSGNNTYTGGTIVDAGTLVLASPTALEGGTSLTVGADAGTIFGSAAGGASTNSSAAGAVVPVPEPGTLVLLLAGLGVGIGAWRRKGR